MVLGGEEGIQAAARGFLVVLALSIHDTFEGVAVGVTTRESAVWFLLLAFASHKEFFNYQLFITFCVCDDDESKKST